MEVQQSANGPAGSHGAAGGLSANTLKLIAIIAMLIDHTASIFLYMDHPLYVPMRFIGRITGPTMFYLVSVGYRHTRNANRYTMRLFVFALVSYVPFIYSKTQALPNADSMWQLNVIYTILLGLIAIRVRNEMHNPVLKVLCLALLIFFAGAGDWGVLGLFMMLAFDYFYGDYKNQAVAYCMLVLCLGGLINMITYPATVFLYHMEPNWQVYRYYVMEAGMFIPIVLLYFYNGQKGAGGALAKWGFYIFYPAHLLILGLIKQYMVL